MTKKSIGIALVCVAVVVFGILLVSNSEGSQGSKGFYDFKSVLVETINIGELSTSKLIHNGVVAVYDESGEKELYRVAYESTIKVGVQVKDIDIDVDFEQKTVKIILPPISVQNPDVDAGSLSFIPPNPDFDMTEAIATCREDARRKAEQSEELLETAEENLKSILEAITLPLLQDEGYTIVW